MTDIGNSAKYLADNIGRLRKAVPVDSKKKLPISTLRTVEKMIKSPTLATVDKLAKTIGAPAWLLIHPDMKRWDKNRLWILRIVEAYLSADTEGKELFHSAVRMADKVSAAESTHE